MKNKKSSAKPRIVVVPHYVGTEKADTVIKKIIADEVKKNLLEHIEKMKQLWYN